LSGDPEQLSADEKMRAVIISQGRSGSTYLQHLLDSHPDVTFQGELLSPGRLALNGQDPGMEGADAVGSYLASRLGNDAAVVGFKMPWDWLLVYPEVWGFLRQMKFRLIFLRRRNKVDQHLSVKLAQLNDNWDSRSVYAEQHLEIDPDELLRGWTIFNHIDYLLERMCERFPMHAITWENLASGQGHDGLCNFLDVEPRLLQSATIRSRSLPKREVIANFDALLERFKEHPIGSQLNDGN